MKTKLTYLTLVLTLLFSCTQKKDHETISISGKVTDFEGNPIDSALIGLLHADFSEVDSTFSDSNGYYKLDVKKGKYFAMWVLRPEEYPTENAVPPEDMRLEFWAWNIIADRDLEINPRYHRLELYRLTAFRAEGRNTLMIYVRPMSLGRSLKYSEDDVTVYPENFEVSVFVDEEEVKVNSIQPIEEFTEVENAPPLIGYIIHIDINKLPEKPYYVIRVEGTNREFNEKGENVCFYEITDYE